VTTPPDTVTAADSRGRRGSGWAYAVGQAGAAAAAAGREAGTAGGAAAAGDAAAGDAAVGALAAAVDPPVTAVADGDVLAKAPGAAARGVPEPAQPATAHSTRMTGRVRTPRR
jgi:hypothetical protein